jgi:hypothetical protein
LPGGGVHRTRFFLDPGEASAMALAPSIAEYQSAWPFTPLTTDNIEEFINRWVDWFATAAQGQLRYPDRMPEREPQGSWRQK